MSENTITAANSVFSLVVDDLYPVAQQLQGYAADRMFATEAMENAEIIMGADGKMSAGFVFNPVKQTITIMADSASLVIFETWAQTQRTAQEIFRGQATIILPAIKRKYTLKRGVLTSAKFIPDAAKTLQPTEYQITWESVVGEPYNP